MAKLARSGETLARTYASVLFCDSPWVGAWFALLTCWSPHSALAGLVCLVAATLWASLFSLSLPGEPHLVNSLLSGLFIGALHPVEFTAILWLVMAALFVTLSAHWLATLSWRIGKLPILSLPFVLVCWMTILCFGPNNSIGILLSAPLDGATLFEQRWLDNFFTSLGWLFLVPYPLAGALLFAGLVMASRYLALLAAAGYFAGQSALELFGLTAPDASGFNFMLTAMALGGIFAVPGRASFLMALAGSALTALFAVALAGLLQPVHLPLLTLPFLLAAWFWLGALGTRPASGSLQLTLSNPAAPEISYERARLTWARLGAAPGSLPLLPPFYGEWRVSQGFNGDHTHRFPWQHALDFDIAVEGRTYQGRGDARSDFFCFGAPLLAPAAGQLLLVRDNLPDGAPGESDVVNNWGNHLLLRSTGGGLILLAHLKQGSAKVQVGEWVAAGQVVAACGSSGRSPEPHLHLHVQSEERLGSPTRPFHLVNVLVRREGQAREFRICYLPSQGERISVAPRDERFATALRLPPGHTLSYRLQCGDANELRHLRTELSLLGQSRMTGAGGASAAYEETPAVLGFYDRNTRKDPMLDLWILALGLTPLSVAADHWSDHPAMRLLPLGPWRSVLAALLRPLGASCDSGYQRRWDNTSNSWLQEGAHRIRLAPGIEWPATTAAWIEPNQGVRRLRLDMFGKRWEAEMEPETDTAARDDARIKKVDSTTTIERDT
jgi:urea transporter